MLPGAAFWMVATACTRTPPSPRTSPPQRDVNSASVYPAVMRASVAALGILGLEVLLHLRHHLVGHIHGLVEVEQHVLAGDQVIAVGLCELLHGLEDVLLQLVELGVAFCVDVILELGGLAAELALQVVDLVLLVL